MPLGWTPRGVAPGLARTLLHALRAAIIAFAALMTGQAHAAWPDRTITLIVIFPPGGSTDLLGRLIAAELAPALGQNVIVENRRVLTAISDLPLALAPRPTAPPWWWPREWC